MRNESGDRKADSHDLFARRPLVNNSFTGIPMPGYGDSWSQPQHQDMNSFVAELLGKIAAQLKKMEPDARERLLEKLDPATRAQVNALLGDPWSY